MMSKIGLDLKTYTLKCAGIGRYTLNLVNHLLEQEQFEYTGFVSKETELDRLKGKKILISNGRSFGIQSTLLRSLFTLPLDLRRQKVDLIHSMDQSVVGVAGKAMYKKVSTIHDMIVYRYPEFFTRKHVEMVKWMTGRSVKKADHIIVPSFSTKNDILKFFPLTSADKISVTPLACDPMFEKKDQKEIEIFQKKHNLPNKYFLSLGTNEPRKNLNNLVKAFQEMKKNSTYDEYSLLLVGGKGWLNALGGFSKEELEKTKIYHLGFVEDKNLPYLYSGAYGFVYPSFYEGFGLPVVEALQCGVPVITSGISSLPEVGGDAALYIDPYSVESVQNAMKKLVDDKEIFKQFSDASESQKKKFSWKKTTQETIEIYQNVLSK